MQAPIQPSNDTAIPPIWRDYRIFDAHAHLGKHSELWWPTETTLSDDELVSQMDRYNVERCAISCLTKDFSADNDLVAKALRKFPDRLVGLAHIDPTAGEDKALKEIDRCLSLRFRGLKLHPEADAYFVFDSRLMAPVLRKAAENRLPILFHTGTAPFVTPIHIGYLAQHFPEVNFICGHMGLADSTFEAPEAGKMAENVFLDMTVVGGGGPLVERAIRRLSVERFVWGTDVPYGNFVGEFFKLLSLRISDADKRKILWDNPIRIYRL